MSGTICEIIIRGNRSQALAESFADAAPGGILPNARLAAHQALTLCQLGTTTYDGEEVMTEPQQERATAIMGEFNDAAARVDASHPFNHREVSIVDTMLVIFNRNAQQLIDDVLANP